MLNQRFSIENAKVELTTLGFSPEDIDFIFEKNAKLKLYSMIKDQYSQDPELKSLISPHQLIELAKLSPEHLDIVLKHDKQLKGFTGDQILQIISQGEIGIKNLRQIILYQVLLTKELQLKPNDFITILTTHRFGYKLLETLAGNYHIFRDELGLTNNEKLLDLIKILKHKDDLLILANHSKQLIKFGLVGELTRLAKELDIKKDLKKLLNFLADFKADQEILRIVQTQKNSCQLLSLLAHKRALFDTKLLPSEISVLMDEYVKNPEDLTALIENWDKSKPFNLIVRQINERNSLFESSKLLPSSENLIKDSNFKPTEIESSNLTFPVINDPVAFNLNLLAEVIELSERTHVPEIFNGLNIADDSPVMVDPSPLQPPYSPMEMSLSPSNTEFTEAASTADTETTPTKRKVGRPKKIRTEPYKRPKKPEREIDMDIVDALVKFGYEEEDAKLYVKRYGRSISIDAEDLDYVYDNFERYYLDKIVQRESSISTIISLAEHYEILITTHGYLPHQVYEMMNVKGGGKNLEAVATYHKYLIKFKIDGVALNKEKITRVAKHPGGKKNIEALYHYFRALKNKFSLAQILRIVARRGGSNALIIVAENFNYLKESFDFTADEITKIAGVDRGYENMVVLLEVAPIIKDRDVILKEFRENKDKTKRDKYLIGRTNLEAMAKRIKEDQQRNVVSTSAPTQSTISTEQSTDYTNNPNLLFNRDKNSKRGKAEINMPITRKKRNLTSDKG